MEKNKYSGIILLIIAVVAAIIIFDPFGGKIEGEWLLNLMGQINPDDYESLSFFSRVLQKAGVIAMLEEKGAKDGDTVNIYDFEFDFVK